MGLTLLGKTLGAGLAKRLWGGRIATTELGGGQIATTEHRDRKTATTDFRSGGYCHGLGNQCILTDEGFVGQVYCKPNADLWDDFDLDYLLCAYTSHAVVFACCQMIATSYAEAPLEIGVETEDKEWQPKRDLPIMNVVNRPNDWYTRNDMEQLNITRKLLTGAAFTWKNRNNGGEITELWPVPTQWVTIGIGNLKIDGYWLHKDKPNELWIDANDMIYDRFSHPANIFGYLGRLQPALHAYQIDVKRQEYLIKMATELNHPGMVITQNAPDGVRRAGMTEKQREALRESLATEGTGGTPVFPPGLKPEFPGVVEDLDWKGVESDVTARICMAFGVPPIIIGARIGVEHATYSNYSQAKRSFYDETMKPLWKAGQETLTRSLVLQEDLQDDSLMYRYDLSDIAELQDDRNELVDIGLKALEKGAITVNEFRRNYLRDDVVADGDVYMRAINVAAEKSSVRLFRGPRVNREADILVARSANAGGSDNSNGDDT